MSTLAAVYRFDAKFVDKDRELTSLSDDEDNNILIIKGNINLSKKLAKKTPSYMQPKKTNSNQPKPQRTTPNSVSQKQKAFVNALPLYMRSKIVAQARETGCTADTINFKSFYEPKNNIDIKKKHIEIIGNTSTKDVTSSFITKSVDIYDDLEDDLSELTFNSK